MLPAFTLAALLRSIGQELFVSDWMVLGRGHQSPDPSEAVLLALLDDAHDKHLGPGFGRSRRLSHATDRISILQPVPPGSRVRLRAELMALAERTGRLHCTTRNTFELADVAGPVAVVDRTSVFRLGADGVGSFDEQGRPRDCLPTWVRRPVDFLHHWARRAPESELDVLGDRRRTYGEGDRDVRQCAAALVRAGVRRGERVAVLTTPRPEFLTILLALSEIGAAWVGLHPRQTLDEFSHIVDDSGARMLFTLAHHLGHSYETDVAALTSRFPSLRRVVTIGGSWSEDGTAGRLTTTFEEFLAEGTTLPETRLREARNACRPDDVAALVYTSGTTGKPKGAMISAGALSRGCIVQAARQHLSQPRVLAYLPVNHLAGVMDVGVMPVALGGCLVYQEHFDPDGVLDLLQRERITVWGGIPTMFQLVTERAGFGSTDLSALERITWGGAPMPTRLIGRLRRTGAKLGMIYGLTEACVALTYSDDDADDEALATTIGKPGPDTELRIADEQGRPVADGEIGEIQSRTPCVMLGYFGMPEATAASFTEDGYLRTGDQAVRLPDGNIRLVGRLVEMYKSGGLNVYPREVEAVLERHPAVLAAAVVPAPDPLYHEVGVAYVAVSSDRQPTVPELEELCRQSLANYKRPKRFSIRAELPMLPNGKIDKQTLTAWARGRDTPA
ncbi:acyl-CoA synthetase (AMP-forming)/AMP-acid ligase II [Streptomyces sp. TLI_235]|nr:AMP-binding protein [Streptomyces sp. TLI_235]PBC69565.1 acyl-CoA synthetase (AMP-forming)/AMP-acid ligase II [Streptomyces sp. TLI_235]